MAGCFILVIAAHPACSVFIHRAGPAAPAHTLYASEVERPQRVFLLLPRVMKAVEVLSALKKGGF